MQPRDLSEVLKGAPAGEWVALTTDKHKDGRERQDRRRSHRPGKGSRRRKSFPLSHADAQSWNRGLNLAEAMRYPYTRITPTAPFRPYLDLVLQSGFATWSTIALVDTGADYSIFPSHSPIC